MDAQTGEVRWSLNVREKFKGKGYGFGFAATPWVEGGRVFLPVGGPTAGLVALDAQDGATIWTAGNDRASYCPALSITFEGRRLIVGYLENTLVLVDAATGKLLHRQRLSVHYDEHSAWPIYLEPHLLLTSPFRMGASRWRLRTEPNGALLLDPSWTSRDLSNDIVSSVLYKGHLYGFDLRQLQASKHRPSRGTFKCLDWSTGKLCWATDQIGQASVLAADDKLLLVNDSGSLILARADPATYQELGRVQLFEDEICWTPPALSQGHLFVRSESKVVCVYVGRPEDSAQKENHKLPAPSAPWVSFDRDWLLSRERDYPNDAFSQDEMVLWFGVCVSIMAGAAAATGLILSLTKRLSGGEIPRSPIFWCLTFVVGFLAQGKLGAAFDSCLFTWPLSLYAAFHVTVLTCCQAEQHPSRRATWLARVAIVSLLLLSYVYFELCKLVGMFVAWCFLIGYLPSFPLTYLAARAATKEQSLWTVAAWTLLAFAVFFWSCEGFLWWKSGQGT